MHCVWLRPEDIYLPLGMTENIAKHSLTITAKDGVRASGMGKESAALNAHGILEQILGIQPSGFDDGLRAGEYV